MRLPAREGRPKVSFLEVGETGGFELEDCRSSSFSCRRACGMARLRMEARSAYEVPLVIGCNEEAEVVLDPNGVLLGMTGVPQPRHVANE